MLDDNEHKGAVLALSRWFKSQDISTSEAAVICADMCGSLIGALASGRIDCADCLDAAVKAVHSAGWEMFRRKRRKNRKRN